MMMMMKDFDKIISPLLKRALLENVMRVVFEKKDGSEREMLCTLQEDFMPEVTLDTVLKRNTDQPKKDNPEVLAVVDTELGEWRSFRLDSIKSVEYADDIGVSE